MSSLLLSPISVMFLFGVVAGAAMYHLLGTAFPLRKPKSDTSTEPQELVFEDDQLVSASTSARIALSPEDLEDGPMPRLKERLSELFPQFSLAFDAARSEGTSFELMETTTTGPIKVSVNCDGARTAFAIEGLPDLLASRILLDRAVSEENDRELAVLRGTVSTSPSIIWRENRMGEIDWVNSSYMSVVENLDEEPQTGWPPSRLFEGASITITGETPHARRSPITLADGTTRWYDVTSFGHENSTLHFATDISKTVQAEEALRNFMQTLTQTFASLPIGLAIFDRTRQLQLFNPSLLDLTTLEPEWLASRPTLYDFINRLREKRMLPERKDFKDWRAKINELDKLAVNGTYAETWVLPTGQTYKVTGRPHPEGAVAFLIEDISAEISLTRKFRRELELSQSLLDNLPESVAVFDADGNQVLSNEAYCDLWDIDPELVLGQASIVEATRQWQSMSLPTPIWGDIREFVGHAGDRAEWFGTVDLLDGRQLACRLMPLAGGATLASFAEASVVTRPMMEFAEVAL
ncbi:MAG: PAS-domain containing protein [Pseudomonadota bacterium]